VLAVILARESEPSGHFIRAWVAQADRNEGRREGAVPERGELTWLRHENKQLRVERLPKSNGMLDLHRKSGEFPMSDEELEDAAATVYEGI
jgi:transposase